MRLRTGRTTTVAAGVVLSLALGGCGGASEDERAGAAVKAYISASAAQDGAKVCDLIVTSLRAQVERAREKRGDKGGCPAAVAERWKEQPPTALAATKVLRVRLDGARGRVAIEGTGHRIRQRITFSVLREDGTWHVGSSGAVTTPDGRRVLTVPSEAMEPGLRVGDQFVEDAHAYDHASPQVGDIVAAYPALGVLDGSTSGCPGQPARAPEHLCADAGTDHDDGRVIKRVVAGPGDRLTFRGGHAIRNGHRVAEPYLGLASCADDSAIGCDYRESITIPAGRYYLVGDNRGSSDDSRFWGAVPADWITGRVR